MPLFTAKDYQQFLEKNEPQPGYIDRVNKEAKDMVKLWIEAQGELMFRQVWSLLSQKGLIQPEELHIPTQAELKAYFAAYLDCVNRTNAMMKRLTRNVK